ncbi:MULTISPECIES: hypothetical protein [Clostridium]|uniref:Uncharacterized protein n=1 Tax=Clostridium cibarium TaxID=2762247 RepID=A0ABR8PNH0_9CLOT|nr:MULTISPECIES: hypothetical protein [Clostridium]MBD7909723.1 hypothetical protein [Clostridium cibarium]
MFRLDLLVYNFIFNNCQALGNVFGFGAFEGFIIYAGVITVAVMKIFNDNIKKDVKK